MRILAIWLAVGWMGVAGPTLAAPPNDASAQAQALFDRHWEALAELRPEEATRRGDHRFGDRWLERSATGDAQWLAHWRGVQTGLGKLPHAALSDEQRSSVAVLRWQAQQALDLQEQPGLLRYTVQAAPNPFQAQLLRLLDLMPVDRTDQVEQLLARLAAYPRRVDQEIQALREGLQLGWVPSRPVLARVLEQLDAYLQSLREGPEQSDFYAPFRRLGAGIDASAAQAFRERGLSLLRHEVRPALQALRDFVAGPYMEAAPAEGGLSRYPGGAAAYALLVRQHTTTDLSIDEIHATGLREVARIEAAMDSLRERVGFDGDLAAFRQFLESDPKFSAPSRDAALRQQREITKRIDPELPRLFAELPRAPYGVRAMPDHMGPGSAAFYTPADMEGRTAGWINVNTLGYRSRPTWTYETLMLHEGVPGHHLQIARARELQSLPAFRRGSYFIAFIEGWGLYAETLGPELGLFRDPYSRYGFLQAQIWRAARLVVDTGLHAKGWTRAEAIDYLRRCTGFDETVASSEIDRYLSDPGQALGYMIGMLRLQQLRERARMALGARFDLRRFHMVLLDGGQLPLDLLGERVDAWLLEERAQAAAEAVQRPDATR